MNLNKKSVAIILALSGVSINAIAQTENSIIEIAKKPKQSIKNKYKHAHSNGCHSTEVSEYLYKTASPEVKKIMDAARKNLQQSSSPLTRSPAVKNTMAAMPTKVTIPVVVHVVHNYGPENIGDYQITDSIDQMNEDFAAYLYAGSVDGFGHLQADVGVTFKLAKLDPWGNPTSGITRTVSNTTYDGTEGPLQNTINWPRDKYLNVWVVNSSDGTGSGSAYSNYPSTVANGTGREFWDGIVVSYWAIGRTGSAISTHHKIMSHEAGHWLNLKHVWGDVYNNGDYNSCSTDDGVNDTPNTSGNTGCSSNYTCGTADNTENFMDYGTCTTMFTYGQSDRMRSALASPVADRSNLWTTANLVATGLATGNMPPVAMANGPYSGTSGSNISFSSNGSNEPGGTLASYHWSFGDGASSNQANPSHSYSSNGTYTVTLTVTDDDGQTASETTTAAIYAAGAFISQETESNDSYSTANGSIGPTNNVQGAISSANDDDWYYFDLTAADTVEIDVNILSNADLDFWVYHESDLNNYVAEAYGNTSLESVQFNATQPGRYFVYVDGWNGETSSYTLSIRANNIDGGSTSPGMPTAQINGPYTGQKDRVVKFSSSGSSASGSNSISNYLWNFGDGYTSTIENPSHIYNSVGNFTVSLTVTDNQGQESTATTSAEISSSGDVNRAPVAQVNGPFNVNVGETINLSSANSYDSDGSIVSYLWDFGDGRDSTQANPNHSYTQAGNYSITLVVTDDKGATGEATTNVTVNDGTPSTNVPDMCSSQAGQSGGEVSDGSAICLGNTNTNWYYIGDVDGYSSIAISTAHGSGNLDIEFSNTGWPNSSNTQGGSYGNANNECIYLTNMSEYWGYIKVSGSSNGASLVVDFDTAGCR